MAATHVTLGEQSWSFDEGTLTLKDAFLIKQQTGLALKPFFEGIADMDPLCLAGLICFLRTKAGDACRIEDIDFAISDLDVTQDDDPPVEAAATTSLHVATA